MLIKHKERT